MPVIFAAASRNHETLSHCIFFFQAEDGIRDRTVTGVQTCALPISGATTDYGYTSFGADVTTPGYVTESALTAGSCGADGSCLYTFVHAIPVKAAGTRSEERRVGKEWRYR